MLRKLFVDHFDPSCSVLVEFDDHRFLVNPKDTGVSFTLMSGQSWQREELVGALELLATANRLRPDSIFADVGANIGTQTVYALLSGRFARAIAIEPEPLNFKLLSENLKLNHMADRAALVNVAASNKAGLLTLGIDPRNSGAHSLQQGRAEMAGYTLKVPADSVDSILQANDVPASRVGLIWIDVEGHELTAIEGMQALISERVPIVVEFNGPRQDAAGANHLKTLLLPNYETVVDLRAHTRGQPGQASTALADFTPPSYASDLLIY